MIRLLISIYIFLLIAEAILSYFPQTMQYIWRKKLKKICDYSCDPVRRALPHHLPVDFSPMIVIFGLYLFMEVFQFLW